MVEESIWDDAVSLASLEGLREERKSTHPRKRQTFDCFHSIARDDRVVCASGHALTDKLDGTMHLFAVLGGRSSPACKNCPEFDT